MSYKMSAYRTDTGNEGWVSYSVIVLSQNPETLTGPAISIGDNWNNATFKGILRVRDFKVGLFG